VCVITRAYASSLTHSHEPGAAKDIQTGSGVVRQLMSDVRTKEGATRQKVHSWQI